MLLKLLIKLTGAHKPRIALRKDFEMRGKRIWCVYGQHGPPFKLSEIPAALVNMYLNSKALNFVRKKD